LAIILSVATYFLNYQAQFDVSMHVCSLQEPKYFRMQNSWAREVGLNSTYNI